VQHGSEVSGRDKGMVLRFDVIQAYRESGEEADAVVEASIKDVTVDILI
jgi:hypothetical protein